MTIKIDFSNDLAQIANQLETVTLRRADSTQQWTVVGALGRRGATQESEPSGGTVLKDDAVWHLPIEQSGVQPRLGDIVIDQQGNRWTILEAQHLTQLGRWKCTTRELRIAHGCHDLVDVDRPVWGDLGAGPVIVAWTRICSALPVKIQPDKLTMDASTTPPTKHLAYRIVLSESIPLEPDDRLTATEGTSFRVKSVQQANRIDVLPVAQVLREVFS